jgi:hypothetical protein
MEPVYTHTTKIGPAKKRDGDLGNPWIHRWHYNDGTYRDVVVGKLIAAKTRQKAKG